MLEELWTEVRDIVWDTGIKTICIEKKCKKAKWLSEKAKLACYSRYLLTSYFCIPVPCNEKDISFGC